VVIISHQTGHKWLAFGQIGGALYPIRRANETKVEGWFRRSHNTTGCMGGGATSNEDRKQIKIGLAADVTWRKHMTVTKVEKASGVTMIVDIIQSAIQIDSAQILADRVSRIHNHMSGWRKFEHKPTCCDIEELTKEL
jgi:hypothetical protein